MTSFKYNSLRCLRWYGILIRNYAATLIMEL